MTWGIAVKQGKTKKYHTSETVPKFNRKIVERCNIDTPKTQVHAHFPGFVQALKVSGLK
jgi:hypothetical protein